MAFDNQTLFINDSIEVPDYRVEIWTTGKDNKFITDISNIAVSSLQIDKERNLPDSLQVSLDFTQFEKRLGTEGITYDEALSPLKTEIKVRRNFTYIFGGTVMSVVLSLGEGRRETIQINAIGYEDLLSKRFVTQAYGNMNYPQIAAALLKEATHEMNWIDNMSFEATSEGDTEEEATYFAGWTFYPESSGSTLKFPKKATEPNQHWNGGILVPKNTVIGCNSIYCVPFTNQDIISRSGTTYNMVTISFYAKATLVGYRFYPRVDIYLKNGQTRGIYLQNVYPQNTNWQKYEMHAHISPMAGEIKEIRIRDTAGAQDMYFSDFEIYRSSYEVGNITQEGMEIISTGIGKAYTDSWDSTGSGIDDPGIFNSYSKDRIRHYHQKSIREAIYEISNLESQNFEYYVDENKTWHIVDMMGIQDVESIAQYPGQVQSIDIERNGDRVINTAYGQGEETVPGVDSKGYQTTRRKIWSAGAIDSSSVLEYNMPLADFKSYDSNIHSQDDIYNAVLTQLQKRDSAQEVPRLRFDSNIYNPGNIGLGDSFGLQISTDSAFRFLSGHYRVYSYTLTLSKDFVESMSITLISPTQTQLQNMSFPQFLQDMSNNIKMLGLQRVS